MFWFHCGRCGSLFQSLAGDSDTRLCPNCGFAPSLGLMEAPAESPPPAAESAPEAEAKPKTGEKRGVKKRRKRHFMLKLACAWIAVLVLIVTVARRFWHEDAPARRPVSGTVAQAQDFTDTDRELLNQVGQKCVDAFSGYVNAGTPEERNQFVLSPITTASRMTRFYSANPVTTFDVTKFALLTNEVLHLPGGNAVETLWKTQDGKIYDAIFREENGEWRLDWDHFARYSDYPWSLFLAGSGPAEGEFRLLARERLAEERKNENTISVVLYAPRFGQPGDTGFQSPEFLVSRTGNDGRLLDAAFAMARSGKRIFGSKLPVMNPDGMIRVRVKVKRTEVDMERRFEISSVIACHWYSINDPGVEPAKPAGEKPVDSR